MIPFSSGKGLSRFELASIEFFFFFLIIICDFTSFISIGGKIIVFVDYLPPCFVRVGANSSCDFLFLSDMEVHNCFLMSIPQKVRVMNIGNELKLTLSSLFGDEVESVPKGRNRPKSGFP